MWTKVALTERLGKVRVKYQQLSLGNAEFGMPSESHWWRWERAAAACSSYRRGRGGDGDSCETLP